MGFNNCYIPDIDVLIRQYEQYGLEWLYNHYRKYDCWSGSSDAMNYLESKVKEYELQQIQMVDKGQSEQTTTN